LPHFLLYHRQYESSYLVTDQVARKPTGTQRFKLAAAPGKPVDARQSKPDLNEINGHFDPLSAFLRRCYSAALLHSLLCSES
jgi:hypothetical protein